MGGHNSKQTVKTTNNLVTQAMLTATQDCVQYTDGNQVLGVYGSGNIVTGNVQKLQLSIDSKCISAIKQKGDFKNKLENALSQTLKDQEQALTEWMDSSGDTQENDITNNIVNTITFNDLQECLSKVNGSQLIIVKGSGNVVAKNVQEQTQAIVSECVMGGGQAAEVANDVTNTVNQHSTYQSKNPFAFITDAIQAALKSAMVIAAIVFVAIVVLVIVFEVGSTEKARAATPPSAATPPTPPTPPAGL